MRFLGRYAGEIALDYLAAVRVLGLDVGKVACPHHPVDPDEIAQPNADTVKLKSPQDMLLDVVDGPVRQRLPSLQALGPIPAFLVSRIRAAIGKGQPADACLGEKNLQIGNPLEHAVEGHLDGIEETGLAESCRLKGKIHLVDGKTSSRVV